jgi:hypothetical protein
MAVKKRMKVRKSHHIPDKPESRHGFGAINPGVSNRPVIVAVARFPPAICL